MNQTGRWPDLVQNCGRNGLLWILVGERAVVAKSLMCHDSTGMNPVVVLRDTEALRSRPRGGLARYRGSQVEPRESLRE